MGLLQLNFVPSVASMPNILIADNDLTTVTKLEQTLKDEGHQVICVRDAYRVVPVARQSQPDLIILDLELPNSNGLILCNELRSLPNLTHVPILFMTTKKSDAVRALDAGGDGFVTKPFIIRELLARVRAMLRRINPHGQLHLLKIDAARRQVWVDKTPVELTPTEFDLLLYLCNYGDEYCSADDLLQSVWQYPPNVGDTALVRNHIHNLRTKLEINANRPQIIVSLHGRGYRVNARVQHTDKIAKSSQEAYS